MCTPVIRGYRPVHRGGLACQVVNVAMQCELAHRTLVPILAIGVDEIAYEKGCK